jgi:hypothetical protein
MWNKFSLTLLAISASFSFGSVAIATPNAPTNSQSQSQLQGQGQIGIVKGEQELKNTNTNNIHNGSNARSSSNSSSNSSSKAGAAAGAAAIGITKSDSTSAGGAGGQGGAGGSSTATGGQGGSSTATSGGGDATGGNAASGDSFSETGDVLSTVEGISGVNASPSTSMSVTEEGDTTLFLPDPVQINLPQMTTPGVSLTCGDFGVNANYTGGSSVGVSLYVLGFQQQIQSSVLPEDAKTILQSVASCGVVNQTQKFLVETKLPVETVNAAEYLLLIQLLESLYAVNGKTFNPSMLVLEEVGRTPTPALPELEVKDASDSFSVEEEEVDEVGTPVPGLW